MWLVTYNCLMNVQESMRKPCRYTQFIKTLFFTTRSHENPYQVLQVTQSVSGATSHTICIRCYKSHNLYQVLQVTQSVSGTASHTICIRCYKSHNLYQVLQVTQSVSGATSHTICIRYCKSHMLRLNVQ